jgi:site-specific recombinase XerD
MRRSVTQAVEDYSYALAEKSPTTQRWYLEKLAHFSTWCAGQGIDLAALTPTDVRRYMTHLRTTRNRYGRALSSYTLHGYAETIKVFLNWCIRENDAYGVTEHLVRRIELPRIDQKVIEVFTREQMQAMLKATFREESRQLVFRDQAMLRLLASTGIRAGELCGITLDDVEMDPFDGYVRVFGKGRKEREVPLGRETRVSLNRYLSQYRRAHREEHHVFLTRNSTPYTTHALDVTIKRLGKWAGVQGVRVSAHTFRHTFAVEFLGKTGDLYRLSRLMGHGSVRVTEMYLRAVKARDARKGVSVFDDL